jgi:hypothetical protein
MRWWLAAALAACGPPQFEMDVYVSPELGQYVLSYHGVDCEARWTTSAGGCVSHFVLEGDVASPGGPCTEQCLGVHGEGDNVAVFGCGGAARAPFPSSYPAAPTYELVVSDFEQTVLAVDGDPLLPTFRYFYSCKGYDWLCESGAPTETIRAPCRTPITVYSDALTTTASTELGTLRVWARQSAMFTP